MPAPWSGKMAKSISTMMSTNRMPTCNGPWPGDTRIRLLRPDPQEEKTTPDTFSGRSPAAGASTGSYARADAHTHPAAVTTGSCDWGRTLFVRQLPPISTISPGWMVLSAARAIGEAWLDITDVVGWRANN